MDGWYPKINERGNVVSGSGSVWYRSSYKDIEGIEIASQGWTPAFLDNSWIMYSNGVNVAVYDLNNNKTIQRPNETYSRIVASNGKYIGWNDGKVYSEGYVAEGKIVLSISKDGKNKAWLEPYHSDLSNLIINHKNSLIWESIMSVAISNTAVIWNTDNFTKTFGIINEEKYELTIPRWEQSYLCDTPNGPWIISKFQDGLGARPFLSQVGQFYPGVWDDPDSIWLNDRIVVVSSEAGNPKYLEIDTSILNYDFSQTNPPNPIPPNPNPDPNPPIEENKIPHIGDNEIIELSELYDKISVNANKDDDSYLRDACYYGLGYIRNRTTKSHEEAKILYGIFCNRNEYYDPTPDGMFTDEEVIQVSMIFIEQYTVIGKYQIQSRKDNVRDETYYAVIYAKEREKNKSHINSLHEMENRIYTDVGMEPPYKPEVIRPLVLKPNKQILIDSEGKPFQVKGITAFKLINLFNQNKHYNFLDMYNNFNAFRVFPYVPIKDWKEQAWDVPANDVISDFIIELYEKGKYVKLTLLTDDDPNRIQWAINLVNYLKNFEFPNLLLEAGNEPLTHKNINVDALHGTLVDSGYLYTSGIYEDTRKFYGKIGNDHSARDEEWPRKVHNLLEYYNGGGPNFPDEPATEVSWCEDEPIRPDQALSFGDRESVYKDYYTYGALCTQFGFGGTFHCESAKYCNLPNEFESYCATGFLTGLDTYPPDTALNDYERIDEGSNTLRTYRIGKTLTRIRPKTLTLPQEGWQALDNWGICFKK